MENQFENELRAFREQVQELKKRGTLLEYAEDIHLFRPNNTNDKEYLVKARKTISLTVTALIHGSESGGLYGLTEFLREINQGLIEIPFSMAIALGNVKAFLKGQRFLEKDLNRCFHTTQLETLEHRRAKELEVVLEQTAWHLDLHQTNRPNVHPFFIFPFTKSNYVFATKIWPGLPIVTHAADDSFSAEGKCSDEFVITKGGTAITIETGQNGFSWYQQAACCYLLRRTASQLKQWIGQGGQPDLQNRNDQVYVCDQVLQPDKTDWVELVEGLDNFKSIEQGQKVGVLKGQDYLAQDSGKVLFPKYLRNKKSPEGQDLYWLLKEASLSTLL